MTDFLFFLHNLDQFIINFFRITVKNTDPANSLNLTKLFHKKMKRLFSVKIRAVHGSFLSYQNQFFYPLFCHMLCLSDQPLLRNTAESSPERRNNAVSTVFVAAFGNLQITIMAACSQNSSSGIFRKFIDIPELLKMSSLTGLVDRFQNIHIRGCSQNCVYLRNLLNDLFFITLRHTACYDQDFTGSCFFILCHFQNVFNTLFFCIMDKTAGIDDNYLCLFLRVHDLMALSRKQPQHFLRVCQVLVAAK